LRKERAENYADFVDNIGRAVKKSLEEVHDSKPVTVPVTAPTPVPVTTPTPVPVTAPAPVPVTTPTPVPGVVEPLKQPATAPASGTDVKANPVDPVPKLEP